MTTFGKPLGFCPFFRAGRVLHGEVDAYADPDITVGDAIKFVASILYGKYEPEHATFAYTESLLSVFASTARQAATVDLAPIAADPGSETRLHAHLYPDGHAGDDPVDLVSFLREQARTEPVDQPYAVNRHPDPWNEDLKDVQQGNIEAWREANACLRNMALGRVRSDLIGRSFRPVMDDAVRALGYTGAFTAFAGLYAFAATGLDQNAARITSCVSEITNQNDVNPYPQNLGDWHLVMSLGAPQPEQMPGVMRRLTGGDLKRRAAALFRRPGRVTEYREVTEKRNGQPEITEVGVRHNTPSHAGEDEDPSHPKP